MLVELEMFEQTCALIKPDLTAKKLVGKVISMIEQSDFEIVQMKKMTMTKKLAEKFYAVHAQKPFFNDVVAFMTSGPIIAMVLKKQDAVNAWRDLMGATNPEKAATGTIRSLFGTSVMENGTHGSDSRENAEKEIELLFQPQKESSAGGWL